MIVGTAAIHTTIETKVPVRNWTTLVPFVPGRAISYAMACTASTTTSRPMTIANARDQRLTNATANPPANNITMTGIHGSPLGPGTQSSATVTRLVPPSWTNVISPSEMWWKLPGALTTCGGNEPP